MDTTVVWLPARWLTRKFESYPTSAGAAKVRNIKSLERIRQMHTKLDKGIVD